MEIGQLKRKLALGSLAGTLRVLLAVPLYLVLTPYMLSRLGAERFGLWSFGTLIVSVMTLTDFGFKNALVYQVARADGRIDEINGHFNVAFWTYAGMAASIAVATAVFGPLLVEQVLAVPERLRDEAGFVLWVTALSFGLRFVSIPYQALIEGHQEHAVTQGVLLGWLLLNFIGTLSALAWRPDLHALGAATVFANAAVLAGFWWWTARHHREVRLGWRHLRRREFRDMLRYGSGIQVATLLIAAREPLLKIMIARAHGLAAVAAFEIVYRLCTQLVSLVATPMLGSFSASALLAREREHELRGILSVMLGFCLAAFVPAVLGVATFAAPGTAAWLGASQERVGAMLPVAFAAFALYYMTEPLYKALEGAGWSLYSALVQCASLAVTLAVFAALAAHPVYAAPCALLAGFALFSAVNVVAFGRRFAGMRLFGATQALYLVTPALAYVACAAAAEPVVRPFVFALYLALHVWCMRRAGIFDVFGMARRLAGVVGARA